MPTVESLAAVLMILQSVLLRSGDLIVMSGPARLAYHGMWCSACSSMLISTLAVPAILPETLPAEFSRPSSECLWDDRLVDFMSCARININVRHVGYTKPST